MEQTVLVVDDNPDVREGIAIFLRLHGWKVATAGHGKAALEVLREIVDQTILVLLDLSMPIMDGATFRKRQLKDPALAHVPVLIISGDDDLPETAAKLDAAGFLPKPFDFRELASAVEQLSANNRG